MSSQTTLLTIPPDVLYLIFPYLTPKDFLSLTSSAKQLLPYSDDSTYWLGVTRRTFRIPNQPLLRNVRWQALYKKLLTQTKLYMWGDNKSGNLGASALASGPLLDDAYDGTQETPMQRRLRVRRPGRSIPILAYVDNIHVSAVKDFIFASRAPHFVGAVALSHNLTLDSTKTDNVVHYRPTRRHATHVGFPRETMLPNDLGIGIVSDVQCGGWSTVILNSIGSLYIFGLFNGLVYNHPSDIGLRRLTYPPAYPATTKDRYEPSTAIQQYSTGRSSVLGLADDGRVWMWESDQGFQVKPVHVDLVEHRVERVVAGWDRNSMYVTGLGIVYWTSVQDSDLVRGGRRETLAINDTMLIETVTIPGTSYRRGRNDRFFDDSLGGRIGQVTNHVVQSGYIVFTTDLNKVFCYRTTFPMPATDLPEPVELRTFYDATPDNAFTIRDLQGAFARFAVFTEAGSVILGTEDLLNAYYDPSREHDPPSPNVIPSLQTKDIVSLAFGDHHFHALRTNGTVTSFGLEISRCGALGLGEKKHSLLRGVQVQNTLGARDRLPDGEGRTVWFEPLMSVWLADEMKKTMNENEQMVQGTVLRPGEVRERATMLYQGNPQMRQAYADFFEREGAKWENNVTNEGGMGAYFVLKIAAAGWHSATLVLVDEDIAERAREDHIVVLRELSPSPSKQSFDSYEVIHSPGEQLSNAVYGIYEWFWNMGRRFLGLVERNSSREELSRQPESQRASGTEDEAHLTYSWTGKPFPRLRLPDGTPMPGEVPLTE